MLETDAKLYEGEVTLLALLLCGAGLAWLARAIRERRGGLDLTRPMAAGFAARGLVVLSFPLLGSLGDDLRTVDDQLFLDEANRVAESPLIDGKWLDTISGDLHLTLFAAQLRLLGGPGGTSLRIVQAALAVAAVALVAVAVHDLAGRRAAVAVGWFLALEPSTLLFTSILHKESLLLLGEAAVVLGIVRSWTRRDMSGAPLAAAGVLLALLTRSYAGLFLLAAALLVHAHLLWTGLRDGRRRPRLAGVVVGALVLSLAVTAISGSALQRVQSVQDADTGGAGNLQLEPVDFTTARGLATGLPRRVFDFTVRPFPWQADNTSQALGVIGTLITWSLYALLAVGLWRSRGRDGPSVIPFLYLGACLIVCYALSTANAGTGYRHRIHLLVPLAAAVAALAASRGWLRVPRGARPASAAACLGAVALLFAGCADGTERTGGIEPRKPPPLSLTGRESPGAAVERYLSRLKSRHLPLAIAQYEPSVRELFGTRRFTEFASFTGYALVRVRWRVVRSRTSGRRARVTVRAPKYADPGEYRDSYVGSDDRFAFLLVRRHGRWRIALDEVMLLGIRRFEKIRVQNLTRPNPKVSKRARRAAEVTVRAYRAAGLRAVRSARS